MVGDKKNATGNSFSEPVGDTDKTFKVNLKVENLKMLPGDYDVKLYNPSGTQIAVSQNGGTTSEAIIYNGGAVGTYKIQVYERATSFL